jgi:hypothetical protein
VGNVADVSEAVCISETLATISTFTHCRKIMGFEVLMGIKIKATLFCGCDAM